MGGRAAYTHLQQCPPIHTSHKVRHTGFTHLQGRQVSKGAGMEDI